MNTNIDNIINEQSVQNSRAEYMSQVYSWMTGGLLTTSAVAYFTFSSGLVEQLGGMILILMFANLGFVWYISSRIETMSKTAAIASFFTYAGLNGIVFSIFLAVYTADSIYSTFLITSLSFGALSAYGRITKKDLSGVGSFMFMGLVGIIIASVVNIFIQSSAFYTMISILGVLIFAGLTAYDTQKIKEQYYDYAQQSGGDMASKMAILGALTLYLDFINLFLFLLRLLGNRR
jgi:FtsH-binding integral membrane protein